jgi:hypothetical protein
MMAGQLKELGTPSHSEIERAWNMRRCFNFSEFQAVLVPSKPLLDSSSQENLYWVPVFTKPLLDSSSYKTLYWVAVSTKPLLDTSRLNQLMSQLS